MELLAANVEERLALARRVDPKYAPAWQGRPAREQAAMAWYFLPHHSDRPILGVTRPRVVKWYCPFADQAEFPSGHRYCINVYTGCSHGCVYCYAAGYLAMDAKCKADFRRMLLRDLDDLEAFDVPAAPVHVANSTDPFQPLEADLGDALFTLRQLARFRHRFTTVTLLTKNPGLLARPEYLAALNDLDRRAEGRTVVVEISVAFWRQEIAAAYDPGAPPVADRIAGIRALRAAGLTVVLRVSPTYPIGLAPPGQPCPQTHADMESVIRLAAEVGAWKVVHTPAKLVRPKHGPMHPLMQAMLALYRRLAGREGLDFRGGSWRLPRPAAHLHVVAPLRELCAPHAVALDFCMPHLLATR